MADLHATFAMTRGATFVDDDDQSTQKVTTPSTIWGRLVSTDGARFPNMTLEGSNIIIGRGAAYQATTQFVDKRMSSKHCTISVNDSNVTLEDHSSNGTWVNGERVANGSSKTLQNGDEISFFAVGGGEGIPCYVFQDKRPPSIKPAKRQHDDEATDDEEPAAKKIAADPTPAAAPAATPAAAAPAAAAPAPVQDDTNLSDNLMCGICHEILYKCVSLIPCLHNFCAGCYSDWLQRSKECPECRTKVTRVSMNHTLNNVVSAYLDKHPGQKRDDDDIQDQDKKNTIKNGMKIGDDDDDDDDSDSDSDDDGNANAGGGFFNRALGIVGAGFGFGRGQPFQIARCRQCPPGDGTYTCPVGGPHLVCNACHQQFPDRAGFPTKCDFCSRAFCRLYWNCAAPNADDTIRKLGDFQFADIPGGIQGAFSGNIHEIQILRQYLQLKNITVTDCFKDCMTKLDAGTYKYTRFSQCQLPTSDKIACRTCASSVFGDLCFRYRLDIPKTDLPPNAQTRPDCYYGKNCRTQTHNAQHAQRYNHACEQTRF